MRACHDIAPLSDVALHGSVCNLHATKGHRKFNEMCDPSSMLLKE